MGRYSLTKVDITETAATNFTADTVFITDTQILLPISKRCAITYVNCLYRLTSINAVGVYGSVPWSSSCLLLSAERDARQVVAC